MFFWITTTMSSRSFHYCKRQAFTTNLATASSSLHRTKVSDCRSDIYQTELRIDTPGSSSLTIIAMEGFANSRCQNSMLDSIGTRTDGTANVSQSKQRKPSLPHAKQLVSHIPEFLKPMSSQYLPSTLICLTKA